VIPPFVSVVTVNYNGKEFLNGLLQSLDAVDYPKERMEVILVDNGSSDGSVEFIKQNFPGVKIIPNSKNSYASGNNLGIKAVKGDYLALINNDTIVDKQWLSGIISYAEQDGTIGAIGSKILFMDKRLQSLGHKQLPGFYWTDIGFGEPDKQEYSVIKEAESICGCCVIFKKKCLDQVGLLDEDFSMYLEDVDISLRCRKNGWKLFIYPQSAIYHQLHGSIKTEEKAKYFQEINRLVLIAKHWPDQLPAALEGRGYFKGKEISGILELALDKVAKEHGEKVAQRIKSGLFVAAEKLKQRDNPKDVQMRFTNRCNMSCKHCDIWKQDSRKQDELSPEQWKSFIDKLYSWLGGFQLDLAGGEILLYQAAVPLIKYAADKGITVNLTTNAMLIDEKMAEALSDSGLQCINLSVDGLEEVHDAVRNSPGAFSKVRQAASLLQKYRKNTRPSINLAVVIIEQNLSQLLGLAHLTEKWGIDHIRFQALDNNFAAPYDAAWFKNDPFWPQDADKAADAINSLIGAKKEGLPIDNPFAQFEEMKRYYRHPEETAGGCLTGLNNFIVDESGNVLVCWNKQPIGSLLENAPEAIWNSPAAELARQEITGCKRTCRILNCNYAN